MLSNNGATDFNLDNGSVNFYSNQGSIRRIDDTTSSQFIRLEQGYFRAERLIDPKAARIVIGTNHDKTEGVENATFAGTRLWSGSGNGDKESFHETVADRIIFYANGKYRSPWMIHNNTRDGYTYFMPLNENRVKHVIGRSDKRLHDIHTNEITLNGVRLKMMLKDIMLKIGYRGNNNWADLIN